MSSDARAARTATASGADSDGERRGQQELVVTCRAVGCTAWLPPTQLFCERHDAMLQSDLRAILGKTYKPGKPPSKVFTRTLERALEEILYAQTAGHRMPREGDFEW
jgi:hypothetical protein